MHFPGSLSVLSHMVNVSVPRIKTDPRVRFKKLRQDYFQCQENSWIDRLRVGTSDEKANILNSSWLFLSSVSVYKDRGFGSQSQNSYWLWSSRVRSSDSNFTEKRPRTYQFLITSIQALEGKSNIPWNGYWWLSIYLQQGRSWIGIMRDSQTEPFLTNS